MSHPEMTPSMEDYLEAIYSLVQENKVARTRDIALSLSVKMPSVTSALKKLSDLGMVNYYPYQYITLTKEGERHAKQTLQKHHTLKEFFESVVDIPSTKASELACMLEHHIDMKGLEKFSVVIREYKERAKG